jgi:hypothetical protein
MLVVCHETAEQAKRARAEKEGKMKELLEQYKRIQGLAIGLRHINQDLPGFVTDEAIEVMINKINLKMHSLAHEIVRGLQQQLDDSTKQLDEPEEIPQPMVVMARSLWAVIPADAEDDVWQKQLGPRKQVSYQIFLAQSHAEEYSAQLRKSKVVPVWGE